MFSKKLDYKFLTEPDDSLKCVICLEVAKDPKQEENCGKLFCKVCIEKNGNKPCPNCRSTNPQYFRDMKSLREIKALHVRCSNGERGCDWKGTVQMLEDHLVQCVFSLVSCPYKCNAEGEELELMRKDLNNHLKTQCPKRDYRCVYCGKKSTFLNITTVHDKVCVKKKVTCPNTECTLTIEREQMSKHQFLCNYTEVACKYASIGCSVRKMRVDMKQHEEDDKHHLTLTLEKIDRLDRTSKSEINMLKNTISSLVKDISSLKDTTSSLKDTTSSLKGTTSSLKKDMDTLNKHELHTFKLPRYTKKKQDNEIFYSEPFGTSGGYRMSIRVDSNGNGEFKNTHVSVFAKILERDHDDDDELCWPFVGEVTIELLNQLADEKHYIKTILFDASKNAQVGDIWGHQNFFSLSALSYNAASNTQYLMNDTLYFRVTVKVDDHKPWLDCTCPTD